MVKNDVFNGWLRILQPDAFSRMGRIRHVLFDFDGTISVLRQGWEEVMIPLMVEAICGSSPAQDEIEQEVREYVDRSSGVLTIRQMQWLSEAVNRHGLVKEARSAGEYKALYLQRLMVQVRERIDRLAQGESDPKDNLIAGAEAFLQGLVQRGARLYLASGTDHADVVREADALGMLPFFEGRVYGALDDKEDHAKERVIQQILDDNGLAGEELLVIGDGPVEIREGVQRRALTLGAATDEVARQGWNPQKVKRLANAGADLLVPDFSQSANLLMFLFEPKSLPTFEIRE